MYTIIRLHDLKLEEFNYNELETIMKYIDDNLYTFPYNIYKYESSILILDYDSHKLLIFGLTTKEIEHLELKYTNV